jgi:PAS domain S-box-containing protein
MTGLMNTRSGTPNTSQPTGPTPPDQAVVLRSRLLDALGEAVVGTDDRGRIVYWNPAAERLFGWTAEEVRGRNVLDTTPARGMRECAREILEQVRAGQSWSGEFRVQDRAGRSFPVLVTTTAMRNGDGTVAGFVGVSRDISVQRAEAEEALHASEERRLLAARATNDVIWDVDLKSGRAYWNEAAQTTFRYTADEVSEAREWWRERIHPADQPRVLESFEQALNGTGQFWSDEYRFLRGDGTYAAVFDRGYITRDAHGQPIRAVGSMVDLTERHRVEEAQRFLAQASMLLDLSMEYEISLRNVARLAVLTLADYCLVLLHQDDRRLRVVAQAHADPGKESLLQKIQARFVLASDADAALARVVRTGRALLVQEASDAFDRELAEPAGLGNGMRDLKSCSHIVAPMIARDRTLGAIVLVSAESGFHYDAHELGLAEELGRRAGLALENARLYESALLADRAKSDFLAIVSHELRTPLTAVLGYVELLGNDPALTERQGTQVRRIQDSAERLLRLIEGILSFSRLDAGREPVQPTRVSVAELVAGVAAIAEPMAGEKGIGFAVDVPSDLPILDTDPGKAQHVLLNLLSNAIKFTEQGRVTVTAESRDNDVVFRVRDTGIGIPPEHVQRVFTPFWQAERADTRRSGGAGLGLSLARRIARMLGGDVRIVASGADGTTVEFQLPAHATEPDRRD